MKICLSCEGVTDTQAHRCGYCDAPLLPLDMVHYPARRGELDASNPLLGTIIDGKYRLQSVLGRGGLGTVFRAQHVGSLVTVALKLLHPRFAERAEYRRALLPEARRAATVVHERCARLLDVGEGDEGITYLAMELVEGQTIDEVMRQGALSPSHAVDLLLQVTAALSAVHEVGLVHCDLSPRNVMVSSRSGRLEAKVLDFGIARSMNIAGRQNQQGELWGFANPAFSAPELLAGADVDARADLYSLGTLGWLMLTGTMPVDDSDAERAVAAVREGNLASWPRVTGVPKRLTRLLQRCLQFEPEDRPASAEEVHRQLLAVRTGRGPGLLRLAAFASASALVVTLAASENVPDAFLESRQGSQLMLSERALASDSPVLHLTKADLAKVDCRYGGFAPKRLRADIARDGEVLAPFPLSPQVDAAASTLTMSVAQQSWQAVVDSLLRASRDGPVDLIFTVPGSSLVRAARVRVDDLPPTVAARIEGTGAGLNRSSRLVVDLEDDIGVDHALVVVALANHEPFPLPLPASSGSFALGEKLAEKLDGVAPQGGGTLTIRAVDRAGNERQLPAIPFESVDVRVPYVTRISGPAGQVGLTLKGDKLRFRVRLSELEAGCSLRCHTGVVADAVLIPLPEPTPGSFWHTLEVSATKLGGAASSVVISMAVVDAAGNTEEREFTTAIVDRNPLIGISAMSHADETPIVWMDPELLLGPNGGSIGVKAPTPYGVVGVRLKRGPASLDDNLATVRQTTKGSIEIRIGALEAGIYKLLVSLAEAGNEQLAPYEHSVDVRVLPRHIDVQVPSSQGRFLKSLLDDGVLLKRANASDQLSEGRGWRLDPELRPYVGGSIWLNGAPLEVRRMPGSLLPDFTPEAGRNLLLVALTDVLGRAVRLIQKDGTELSARNGRTTVADFWWSDASPRLIGEALLVEHGQPVRIRIRLPLPFDGPEGLRLRIANGEVPATRVTLAGNGSIASFDVKFAEWSRAAKLEDNSREQFANGIESSINASVATPASDDEPEHFSLRLRTTRSTLSPMRLADFVDVPKGLEDLRLLPLLAPSGEFLEPVPSKPPRFAFRPQWPVNVRNMADIMLQDREFEWGQARALMTFATTIVREDVRLACVHHFDPLGVDRLQPLNLLPPQPVDATGRVPAAPANDAVLTGVDFFQAWAYSRLIGLAVAGDASLFRLPFGCELELAAFGDVRSQACHGVAARGGAVQMSAFRATTMPVLPWTGGQTRSFGDVIKTSYGFDFVGLDFGVREWVLDLPHMPGAENLLATWTGDHAGHLARVMDIAAGKREMLPARLGLQRQLAVVRGLAFGEAAGLIDENGKALTPGQHRVLPDSVPGVLRTEQLSRDGRDLLSGKREPRLQQVGFRVVGDAKKLAKKWGYR